MIVTFTLPRLGETMETGRVSSWLKQPGEAFRRGETLVEIETDKTLVEMPALADGVLQEIIVAAGEDADVGAVLCRYDDGAATPEAASPAAPEPAPQAGAVASPGDVVPRPDAEPPATVAPEPIPGQPMPTAATVPTAETGRPRATPLARVLARQNGIALGDVSGTGRRGRIEASDVKAKMAAPPVLDPTPVASRPVRATRPQTDQTDQSGRRDWTPPAEAPRIVLLHGLAADLQSWASIAAMLSRAGRHVTAFDLPGHGQATAEATDLDAMAAAMAAAIERIGDDAVELVGHSVGGAVAARVARLLGPRIGRLTLIAPAGLDRAIDVEFVRGIARARSGGALSHLLRRLVVRPAPMTASQLDSLAAELGRGRLGAFADTLVDDAGQQIDITGDLRALSIPLRVVWGLQDRIIPWTQVQQVGVRCAVHLVNDAGHVPHWDKPAEVAALFD